MTATTPTFTRGDLIKAREELVRSRGEVAQLRKQLAETEQALAKAKKSRAVSETVPCPHCEGQFPRGAGLAKHVRTCPKRPEAAARSAASAELAEWKRRATAAERRCQDLLKQLEAKGAGAPDELVARAERAEQRARKAERFAAATVFRAEAAEAEVTRLADELSRVKAANEALRAGIATLQAANRTLVHAESTLAIDAVSLPATGR